MSANYVAREVGFDLAQGWMQGDAATNAHFSPIAMFGERFDNLLHQVRSLGFTAIDLWTAHLNPQWATHEHLDIARELLARHDLTVPSLAGGGMGETPAELARSCEVALAVGAGVLAGGAALWKTDPAATQSVLQRYGIRLGLENHAEKSPGELLARIGDGASGMVGAAVDTGWFATQGCPPAVALAELASCLHVVHLKDVKPRRSAMTGYQLIDMGHETCALGEGIADIPACVRALRDANYTGPISIEHEPEHFSPDADCRTSLVRLRAWLTDAPQAAEQ